MSEKVRQWLVWLVDTSGRHPWVVLMLAMIMAAASLASANAWLSIDSDSDHLFSADLPWRQQSEAFAAQFPQFSDTLTAVVRAPTVEEARENALLLATELAADSRHFHSVSTPGINAFFDHQGLLLLPSGDLFDVLDSMLQNSQLLDPLVADPSARGLFKALNRLVEVVDFGATDYLSGFDTPLRSIDRTLNAALAGQIAPLSWQTLLTPQVASAGGAVELVLIHPDLDHGALEPGRAATQAMLDIAARLPDVENGRVQVHYTGSVPLSDEEFQSLTDRAVPIAIGTVVMVLVLLALALRSWRMVLAVMLTVMFGLVFTLGFAALAVGRLNMVSVAFAVLFVGLAVDFGIQFGVRLQALRRGNQGFADTLHRTALHVTGQIGLAALATACGFLAFAPTHFSGMAELGIIAGVGMLLALFSTLTILPALLRLLDNGQRLGDMKLPGGGLADGWLAQRPAPVLLLFVLLAGAGTWSALDLPFDANPLHTKRADTEAMQTLSSLMNDPDTNPFTLNVLVADLAAARSLSARLSALPEVEQVVSAADFVPEDQTGKLEQIKQALDLMYSVVASHEARPTPTAAELREVARSTSQSIARIAGALPANSPLRDLGESLGRLAQAPDSTLTAANAALSRFLPETFKRLGASLSAQRITLQSLPDELRRDWFTADGRVRIQVTPGEQAQTTVGLRRFVEAVQAVAPEAVGSALDTVESADTILQAFNQAAACAALALAVVLMLVLRRLRDTLLVLLTLLMSALLTALLARLLGLSINFANIIALPLLLGVGVSFNVYFVMNWRSGGREFLGSPTAHAILFSALTTGAAFGSLAIARHPGTASMGLLLLLSLFAVLLSTFVFLPALLYRLSRKEREGRAACHPAA
ncbi:MMPL family transporter [Pseudomonas sp. NPDC090202]|uniref:MMPL family transporter n=1 Tax=unclassified Pseudomonas TaxID=196821 RepID=UPI0038203FD6